MLRRKIAAELERWLKSSEQKALFITGSRQIGKSYSIRAFGKANHATYIELNLMENRQAKDALLEARDADDFISRVTLLSGKSIAPGKTLVFIDEVQEAPDIMTMAKFLVEDGRCRWAFSGSMLGTQLKGVRSYPVGYVHELRMFPLDFEEFCWAIGVSEGARQTIRDACISERPIPDYIHDAMMANFRTYTVVGGMPEVVQRFLDTQGDLASVRRLQSELNEQYGISPSMQTGEPCRCRASTISSLLCSRAKTSASCSIPLTPRLTTRSISEILYGLSMPALLSKPIS